MNINKPNYNDEELDQIIENGPPPKNEYQKKREEGLLTLKNKIGDGIAYANAIKQNGMEEIKELIKNLPGKHSGMEPPENMGNELILAILRISHINNKLYIELLDALADILFMQAPLSTSEPHRWSHSLCHLFEDYSCDDGSSFFNSSKNEPIMAKLIQEAARRMIKQERPPANETRIIGPLIEYNIHNLKTEQLDAEFPFRPNFPERELFAQKFDNKSRCFLTCKNPREFITQMVINKWYVGQISENLFGLISAVKEEAGEENIKTFAEEYIKINDREISIDELAENVNMANDAKETADGIFVDVDGTLINRYGKLNEQLLYFLAVEAKSGKQITIFTGGSPDEQTEKLRTMGIPEIFLPVLPKEFYKGKRLETLIDDTPPIYQGFSVKTHINPNSF